MEKTLAERFARYANELQFSDLPQAAIHEAQRRVLDSFGVALGAFDCEPCKIARKVAAGLEARRGATLWGIGILAPLDWAAFANGCMVRYFDYNDTYLSKEPAHPSDNIPALIAVAESLGSSGRDLLTAIVISYEVQCRLCDAASLRAIGWDHVTYGCFSTALGAAKLMKLDAEKMRQAVNIAGVHSAALRQSRVGELSHWKGVAFADAARQGVYAAMLAAAGMTGPSPIFEGEKGFMKLVSGKFQIAGPFAEPPQKDGCMINQTSIKCWPVEYHAQSAVDAALKLRPQIGDVAKIEKIVIQSHDAAVDIIGSEPEKWRPNTRETADHSLPYIVGAALADGKITEEQFATSRFSDPKLLDLVSKIKVERHTELSRLYPGAVGNIVNVTLSDGRNLSLRVDHALGHARNPMRDSDVENKFYALVEPRFGRAHAEKIVHWAWNLSLAQNLSPLPQLLEVPA